MSSGWKDTLATVAPALATALGSPLVGIAVNMAGKALGLGEGATQDMVAQAVNSGNPEIMLQLKQADHDFKARMKEAGVRLEEVRAKDRQSARDFAVAKGMAPQVVLSVIYTVGYFGMVYLLFTGQVIIPEAQSSLGEGMVAIMTAAQLQILNYWFGSSAGSKDKANAMAGILKA